MPPSLARHAGFRRAPDRRPDAPATTEAGLPRPRHQAPLWLRLLLLFVLLWLGVRIVGNVTDTLTGIADGRAPAPPAAIRGE